jgi:type III secretory pathway component EscU
MSTSASATQPLIILVAGPYRSGTNNDPQLIAKNLDRLERFSLQIYEAGHIPLIGEWVALPIAKQAGSSHVGDAISEQFLYPVANRLIQRCDAVLRIEGPSKGADEDVRLARQRGLPVYFNIEEVPSINSTL